MSHTAGSRLSDVLEARESIELELPIQMHSRPSTPPAPLAPLIPVIDLNTGVMDEAVERHLLSQAHELGVEVPPQPGFLRPEDAETDVASTSVSTLTVSSAQDSNTIPSRRSQSTRPTSCSSSAKNEFILPTPQPAYSRSRSSKTFRRQDSSAASVAESTNSTSSKLLRGFRRLSSFTKRRSSVVSNADQSSGRVSFDSMGMYFGKELSRPETAGTIVHPDRGQFAGDSPSTLRAGRTMRRTPSNVSRASSIGAMSLPPTNSSYAPISARPERSLAAAERAKRRTLQSPRLQSLRLRQIDEQTQFLGYHQDLLEGIRARCTKDIATATASYEDSKIRLEDSQIEVQAALEDRHLAAEMELSRALAQERQACETKLKHMDAYCNGRLSVVDGGNAINGSGTKNNSGAHPKRKVTEEDYRKLVQQYHIRKGMDNLHEARINVLRKKQAKQVERITQRQGVELNALRETYDREVRRLKAAAGREELELRTDFDVKKERLSWRWKLMETVERKKLEVESSLTYGDLPELQWGDHVLLRPMRTAV